MVSSINNNMGNTVWANSSMQRGSQGKDPFTVADTDGDGSISQTELDAVAAGIEEITESTIDSDITTYDTDEDGSLSREELMEMLSASGFGPPEIQGQGMQSPPPPPSPGQSYSTSSTQEGQDPFAIADTDENGTISSAELAAEAETIAELIGGTFDAEEAFSEYDTDESGSLEQDEYMAMLAGSGLTSPQDMKSSAPPPPPEDADDSEESFDIADTNEDGTVSAEELAALVGETTEITGTVLEKETPISEYVTDENGTLDQEEYLGMLAGSGIGQAEIMQGPPPPPPPSSAEAIAAYTQFESEDPMSQLLNILSTGEEETSTSSTVSVTS